MCPVYSVTHVPDRTQRYSPLEGGNDSKELLEIIFVIALQELIIRGCHHEFSNQKNLICKS